MEKFSFFLLIGISLLTPRAVFSQLMIDKAKVSLTIQSEETIKGEIGVHNFSSHNVEVKVYPQDFLYLPPFDGRKRFLPPGSTKYSCAGWISFFPQQFQLPPRGKKKVVYTIRVPRQVSGGYYGVLFFETGSSKIEEKKVNLQIVQRVGCLFFLETKDKIKQGEVKDISIEGDNLKGKFLNQGNTILLGKGVFYIMSEEGVVIERGKIDNFYLPPQKETPFVVNLKEVPQGNYIVVFTFDLQKGDVLVKEINFLKDKQGNVTILSHQLLEESLRVR